MGVGSVPTQTEMAKQRTGPAVSEDEVKAEMERTAEREEERRDLLAQVEGIEKDESEILFMDTSPRRPMAIIYAMLDGEPIVVTRNRARKLLERTLPDGSPMFTGVAAKAPVYRKGNLKCFLHKDSEERALMDSLGLVGKFCPAGHLANSYAKYVHESGKHVKTYAIWEQHAAETREKEAIERQERQFQATLDQNAAILELARSQAKAPAPVAPSAAPAEPLMQCSYEGCDYTGTPQQVGGHKGKAHKERHNG